ncbi:hypothetical protein KC614_00055 [candidate division WWE3 bacterium]|uniref:Uncharacterized protein n=1 Tax=candidate division WWE3 bacterium TaxID=2053526 RepID=A0A955LJ52_UNCKA|nr:hypothetical protein [candidate division WWE3 bacterium]
MMDNHKFNLLNQMVQEHKSLWRIKNMYLDDAEDCTQCKEFWQGMISDKEQHIEELERLIKAHLE